MAAVGAFIEMTAECGRAAMLDRRQHFEATIPYPPNKGDLQPR